MGEKMEQDVNLKVKKDRNLQHTLQLVLTSQVMQMKK